MNLSHIPKDPGCYLFKDSKGIILYVGKAKNLSNRVRSYFSGKKEGKTAILVSRVVDIDFIVTDSEVEALILENNLIKKHTPKFNIDLKDSKRYAYLTLTSENFSRLVLSRKRPSSGRSFGPFVSGEKRDFVKETIIKTFQIRTCRKLPKRACLRYHIGLCTAPCVGKISKEEYETHIEDAAEVLSGRTNNIIKKLKRNMKESSLGLEYELALRYRNQINSLEYLSEKQKMERKKKNEEDIINYVVEKDIVYLMMFSVRKGVLEEKQEFEFSFTEEFLEEFLVQYYSDHPIPKSIIVPSLVSDSISKLLKASIVVPKQGEKKKLLELVSKNIAASFFPDKEKLTDLKKHLRLQEEPSVVECFDISHLAGTFTVASMVQFRNGKTDKNNYRRFKIKTVSGIDDFSSIKEVVSRRYRRLIEEHTALPNLIVIDGGKGQLTFALEALKELGVRVPIVSLAKKEEEVFVPGLSRPLPIPKRSKASLFLQEIRDEAHRFAIKYNRLLRGKKIRE